jgi:hypothetical protein
MEMIGFEILSWGMVAEPTRNYVRWVRLRPLLKPHFSRQKDQQNIWLRPTNITT